MVKKRQIEKLDFGSGAKKPSGLFFTRYDSAVDNPKTREMFIHCDGLTADASDTTFVRKRIREFARKEVANNSYAKGLVNIVAGDMIGTGPRLQIEDDIKCNEAVERTFNNWAQETSFYEKLKTACKSKIVDGESFFVFYRDKRLKSSSKLNLKLIESDQVETPYQKMNYRQECDGIELDDYGDPKTYYILKDHPGARFHFNPMDYVSVPVDSICHWYQMDRATQHRGISELNAALPIFYMLRRFTLATVEAAEIAARFPMILYTDSPAIQEVQGNSEPFSEVDLQPGKITAIPEGWKIGQIKAEQPTSTYSSVKRELIVEAARCLCVPANVALGDSSGYNYASGMLDNQSYHRSIEVQRKTCESQVLNKIFERWFEETYISNYNPNDWICGYVPKVSWFWDGFSHSDPIKEANAQKIRLENMTSTLSIECAKRGYDYALILEQIAKEKAMMKELGLDPNQHSTLVNEVEEDERTY